MIQLRMLSIGEEYVFAVSPVYVSISNACKKNSTLRRAADVGLSRLSGEGRKDFRACPTTPGFLHTAFS